MIMHMIFIPRVAVLIENKLTVILLGGLFYSVFSLFDQGVDYSSFSSGFTSFTYIVMTQTLVGMGKANVVTKSFCALHNPACDKLECLSILECILKSSD